MKNIIIFLSLFTLLTTSVILLHNKRIRGQQKTEPQQTTIVEEIPPPPPPREEVILSTMTPEEKVGQLFIFGIEGVNNIDSTNKEFLLNSKPGGIILFAKNINNEQQVKTLITELQSTSKIPLFISLDQEGEPVARIKWDKLLTKQQKSIKTGEEAYNIAKSRGELLKSYGFNMNFAPVGEYITNTKSFLYHRTFSGDINSVIEKTTNTIKGYTDTNVIPVLKHFPGHSNTSPDSHTLLPSVNIQQNEWESYLQPFSAVLQSTDVDAIMVGHIKFPQIDPNPSTLSKEIITNRLKNNLQFDGVVISDDMEMGPIRKTGKYQEITKMALDAGVDILIFRNFSRDNRYGQKLAYEHILEEVKNGNMDIDQKVLKILKMKLKYQIIEE